MSFLNIQIFYFIHKIVVKDLCTVKTFSEVTSMSGVTVSYILLGIFSEVTSLSGIAVFLIWFTCSAWSTYVKGVDVGYASSVHTAERSGMHSQSFWNLEMRGAGLEIRVKASYAYIESACIGQNLKVGDAGLKIRVKIG